MADFPLEKSKSLIINMTTFAARQQHYIDATLASLAQSDGRDVPVNLILGSVDTSHVEQYRASLTIVPWDQDAESRIREGHPRHNCNVNALRALRYGANELCLCCEDDIRFEKDWLSQLLATIAEIPDDAYVLNLSVGRDPVPDTRYSLDPRKALVGAQALFYPSKTLRTRVADYLEQNITQGMNDNLIGKYVKQHHALYRTTPKLVHHIGQVSSFHKPKPAPSLAS